MEVTVKFESGKIVTHSQVEEVNVYGEIGGHLIIAEVDGEPAVRTTALPWLTVIQLRNRMKQEAVQ